MTVTRKRKHTLATVEGLDEQKRTQQRDISQLDVVTQAQHTDQGEPASTKKRKTLHRRPPTPPPTTPLTPQNPSAKGSNKRKRDLNVVEEEPERVELIKPTGPSIFARFARPQIVVSARNKRVRNALPSPSECQSPSKLFRRLNLDEIEPDSSSVAKGSQQQHGLDTPPDTPEPEKIEMDLQWPVVLQDMARLHSAFITALNLYYSHNGASSPVEVRILLSSTTSCFKKRAVTLEDLRRVLGVGKTLSQSFALEDFGRAGICLRKLQPRGRSVNRTETYIDEVYLSERFEIELGEHWSQWQAGYYAGDAVTFMEQLTQASITPNASAEKAAPMFSRGKQRLADLKSDQAAAQQSQQPATVLAVAKDEKTATGVASRGASLLDRLVAKQSHLSSLPAGPTKEQLERKSALHRVEEVARVIELLAAGRPRASFSLAAAVSHLQQSLRNPISNEEAQRCLGLMSCEVCPAFVQMMPWGGVVGVVVTRAGKLSLPELKMRVTAAGA